MIQEDLWADTQVKKKCGPVRVAVKGAGWIAWLIILLSCLYAHFFQ